MKWIRVAAAVMNQTPLAWDQNTATIREAIATARGHEVQVLCCPELCITGYGCEDAFLSPGIQETALGMLQEIVPDTKGMIVTIGLPVRYEGGLYSAAAVAVDGQLAGLVAKQNLAGEGIHYEPRWFKPWPSGVSVPWHDGRTAVPLGDLVFDIGSLRLGIEICEDAWVANRPGIRHATQGVDLILNPSASHFAFGKHPVRRRFVLDGSRTFQLGYVYANLLGNESGRAIFDGDAMIASCGKMVATGERFSFTDCQVTWGDIDIDLIRTGKTRTGSFRPNPAAPREGVVPVPFVPRWRPSPGSPPRTLASHEVTKFEEFTLAVTLGLFDYLRKSASRGFVVSLSGGADSAAVACLVDHMVLRATHELGVTPFLDKLRIDSLRLSRRLDDSDNPRELTGALLTCVYQSTRNSSDTTRNAARELATAIGATFHELDVDPIVQQYIGLVSTAMDLPLTWEAHDATLQNIQARARGPSVWMFANLSNALLLATSNRSEAAVGYATMDGDTCGGLSPIAGIDKAFLRQWLVWMEQEGPPGGDPIPALHRVNSQQPTAELRPLESSQTDEDDLMPYPVLDAIERAAIRDKRMPKEVFALLRADHPDKSKAEILSWVDRFFTLWSRNQWKRERYAPSFHLDDENLDPKTWCRFPILSGGFARELRELRRELHSES